MVTEDTDLGPTIVGVRVEMTDVCTGGVDGDRCPGGQTYQITFDGPKNAFTTQTVEGIVTYSTQMKTE